ncbi:MAG: class 1 isoprenoid biosynthesis enzyme [Pseudomonadota bacterium]
MTLDPVFRSPRAVRLIEDLGLMERLSVPGSIHAEATEAVHGMLPDIIGEAWLDTDASPARDDVEFLQRNFFLILFLSIFEGLGCRRDRVDLYARLDLCIKGIITAGDNLFDDQNKQLLPLRFDDGGTRFPSILQMLCFTRLSERVLSDAVAASTLSEAQAAQFQRSFLTRLAEIGALEGSEEDGVAEILPVEPMINKVHRVRGGALFSLAFIAPDLLEDESLKPVLAVAGEAVIKLGVAFQIVDDITDFEFDLTRGSHNILTAYAYHSDVPEERTRIRQMLKAETTGGATLEEVFPHATQRALLRAREEARAAFQGLVGAGFWMAPDQADLFVDAIVGIEGVDRIEQISDNVAESSRQATA